MGALRGLPLPEGRDAGEGTAGESRAWPCRRTSRFASSPRAWRRRCNCSARWCTIRKLVVLDEPFSGLDAINQGKLEVLIRGLAGTRHHGDLFHPRHRPCRTPVRRHRHHRRGQGALRRTGWTKRATGFRRRCGWKPAMPTGRGARRCPPARGAKAHSGISRCPKAGSNRCCKRADRWRGGHSLAVSIERAGLHDAFVAIAGEAAARDMLTQSNGDAA